MRIGTDIDGVTGDFTKSWTSKYKDWFGRNPAPSAYTSWDGITAGTHFEDEKQFFEWTDRAHVWRDMPVVPGAQGVLGDLYDLGHQITFLTSRHKSIEFVTKMWVSTHFGHVKADVKFTGEAKGNVPCSVYIDDSPTVLERLAEAGRPVVVFERHWNRGFLVQHGALEHVHSAKSWDAIFKLLREIS